MSDFDRNSLAARGIGADRAVAIDQGLRAYMIRVYNYMAAGVGLTGVVAWLTFNAAVQTNSAGQLALTSFGQGRSSAARRRSCCSSGTLGLVFFMSFRINRCKRATALVLFMLYAALLGLMLPRCFLAIRAPRSPHLLHLGGVVRRVVSLYGYTTQRDLSRSARSWSGAVRAHPSDDRQHVPQEHGARLRDLGDRRADLRRLDRVGHPADHGECTTSTTTAPWRPQGGDGALTLYLDFINLFLFLLRFSATAASATVLRRSAPASAGALF